MMHKRMMRSVAASLAAITFAAATAVSALDGRSEGIDDKHYKIARQTIEKAVAYLRSQ